MPAKKLNQPVNTFVKGLITEASPLTFPENASLDEVNFRLCRDGSREKRLGMDPYFKKETPLTRINFEQMYGSAFKWEAAQIDGDMCIGVIQIGNLLYFIDLLERIIPYDPFSSIPLLNGGQPVDTGLSGNKPIELATLNGYLLLLCEELPNPYLAYYNKTTDVVTFETANIQIRDFYGVDDGLAINERPTSLSETHRYNLRNQGWTPEITTTCGTDVLDCTFSTLGYYPSNSDTWLAGKIGDLTDANVDKYDPSIAARNFIDAGQVPRGHYILDLYNRGLDRHNHTGTTLPTDHETHYASTIAAYAGRAWYSGIKGTIEASDSKSPRLSNAVLFSQVFTDKINLIKCFQEADPTSWRFNEVVDTDGGIIHIPGCSGIRRLFAQKQSLFVFADNGVWEIRGGSEGFKATSFEVRKINSFGISAKHSIVDAMGNIFYWGYSGIYAILPDPNMDGVYTTQNVTQMTIQSRYDTIDAFAKTNAKGIYDPYNNKIRWLFSDYTGAYNAYECNHMPHLLQDGGSNVFLLTRKSGYSPDYGISYATRLAVNPQTNEIEAINRQVLASGHELSIVAHTGHFYTYRLTYYYRDTTDASGAFTNNTRLIAQNFKYDVATDKLIVKGDPVELNTQCASSYKDMASIAVNSEQSVVAFLDFTSWQIGLQSLKSHYTTDLITSYGPVTTTTLSTDYDQNISMIPTSGGITYPSSGVLCYTSTSTKKVHLDFFTVDSSNNITIRSTTEFPNATQMPTGTTECYDAHIAFISHTKYLVTCRIRNTTLGYSDVIAAFIVTRSATSSFVLSSTTILIKSGITGATEPRVSLRTSDLTTALLVYQYFYSGYEHLDYLKLDISGTTPVISEEGTLVDGTGQEFHYSHIHTELFYKPGSFVISYRGSGSMGLGSSVTYAMDL